MTHTTSDEEFNEKWPEEMPDLFCSQHPLEWFYSRERAHALAERAKGETATGGVAGGREEKPFWERSKEHDFQTHGRWLYLDHFESLHEYATESEAMKGGRCGKWHKLTAPTLAAARAKIEELEAEEDLAKAAQAPKEEKVRKGFWVGPKHWRLHGRYALDENFSLYAFQSNREAFSAFGGTPLGGFDNADEAQAEVECIIEKHQAEQAAHEAVRSPAEVYDCALTCDCGGEVKFHQLAALATCPHCGFEWRRSSQEGRWFLADTPEAPAPVERPWTNRFHPQEELGKPRIVLHSDLHHLADRQDAADKKTEALEHETGSINLAANADGKRVEALEARVGELADSLQLAHDHATKLWAHASGVDTRFKALEETKQARLGEVAGEIHRAADIYRGSLALAGGLDCLEVQNFNAMFDPALKALDAHLAAQPPGAPEEVAEPVSEPCELAGGPEQLGDVEVLHAGFLSVIRNGEIPNGHDKAARLIEMLKAHLAGGVS